jgi:hypothetical protein
VRCGIWKRPPSRGLKDLLGDAAAEFTVKAEKVDNTTATISMRGPYAIFKPLLDSHGLCDRALNLIQLCHGDGSMIATRRSSRNLNPGPWGVCHY